jgi:RHS repeat-associated protein
MIHQAAHNQPANIAALWRGVQRYGFNGKEGDDERMGGGGNTYDYGFRIYNEHLSRFLSTDPLSANYPMLTPYQFASNTPLQAIDLDGLEAYFIHGTASGPERWLTTDIKSGQLNDGAQALYRISNNTSYDASFNWGDGPMGWGNGVFNTDCDRESAANQLVDHVLKTSDGCQDITLIGHSHGGNVAIQAVPLLRRKLDEAGKCDVKINIITVATPADNKSGSSENPQTHIGCFKSHVHIYNEIDGIQTTGANIMDFLNIGRILPEKFERSYNCPKTSNYNIDVSSKYDNPYVAFSPTLLDRIGAHSFDVESDFIELNTTNGVIKELE